MTEENQKSFNDFVELASDIVSSYVSNNSVPASELPGLIISVHTALTTLSSPEAVAAPAEEVIEKPSSGQVRKSVTPDAIISFIDGKPYKTLKRHLGTHGLDPYSYRQRYGLRPDYPMVAEDYSQARRDMAKKIGLGRKPSRQAEAAEEAAPAPAPRGRRKAAAASAED